MKTKRAAKQSKSGQQENILYVAFHGLISLVETDKDFIAHLLDMGKEHKYLYGDWLSEQEILEREGNKGPLRATLEGVFEGDKSLDPLLNVIVELSALPKESHRHVRAILKLPKPRQIHHFTIGKLQQGALQGDLTSVSGNPTHLSGVRIFEYRFSKKSDVVLRSREEILWRCPALAPVGQQRIAVLHVYDQPGKELPAGSTHNLAEFKRSSSFLGVKLTLTKNTKKDNELLTPSNLGILEGEVACLSRRAPFALRLVSNARRGAILPGNEVGGCGSEVCAGCDAVVIRHSRRAGHKLYKRGD